LLGGEFSYSFAVAAEMLFYALGSAGVAEGDVDEAWGLVSAGVRGFVATLRGAGSTGGMLSRASLRSCLGYFHLHPPGAGWPEGDSDGDEI
jgi:hypothetical protein